MRSGPGVAVYIDGPFFPKSDLSVKENQKYLRDEVYETMVKRSKASNVEYIRYVKLPEGKSGAEDRTATA